MTLARVVRPETLDALPAEDPAARRSRRDLVRVHLAMGTRGLAARAWAALLPAAADADRRDDAPLRILELGAGDGTLALAVARRLAGTWPHVRLTLLDRQDIVDPATLAAFAELGWRADVDVTDVLDWATDRSADRAADRATDRAADRAADRVAPERVEADPAEPHGVGTGDAARPWDLIVTALFLHHFEGAALAALLDAVAARTAAFHAFEPRRDRLALLGSHLIGALGTNAVTRRDAVLSVHAGFRGEELSASWPGAVGAWRLREGAAGPFGHGFAARRVEIEP